MIKIFLSLILTFCLSGAYSQIIVVNSGRFIVAGGSSYDSEAQAYFDAVTAASGSLTTTEKDAWNVFVVAAKADGTWAKITVIYPILGGTAATAVINAKTPGTFNGTISGTMTVTAAHIVSNGSTGFMNTGFNPTVNDTDGFGTMGVWIRNNVSGTMVAIGAISATNRYTQIYPLLGGETYGQYNSTAVDEHYTTATSVGWVLASRTATNSSFVKKNANTPVTTSLTTMTLTNANIYVGAQNNAGSAQFYSTHQIAVAMIAATAFSTTDATNIYTNLSTFTTAVSK